MSFSKFNNFSHVSGTSYELNESVTWEIGRKGSGYKLVLEKDYMFNISVPKHLTWVVSPHNEKVLLAAAVHDKLIEERFDIAFASAEFRRAAIARGYNPFGSWALFTSTYLFLSAKYYLNKKLPKSWGVS